MSDTASGGAPEDPAPLPRVAALRGDPFELDHHRGGDIVVRYAGTQHIAGRLRKKKGDYRIWDAADRELPRAESLERALEILRTAD